MIITKTPFRISFAGGGSDIGVYYRKNGGAVLSTSINKYMYLSMHPHFSSKHFLLKYSKTESVSSVEQIEHRILKEVFKSYSLEGVDFNSSADIPSGTGLGSSSSFTVGLISLVNAYLHRYLSKEDIACEACEVEIERLGEPIGKQDQYTAAYGGLNYIKFNKDESVEVRKVIMNPEKLNELQGNLLMLYLGKARSASKILEEQKNVMENDESKVRCLDQMVSLAYDLYEELSRNRVDSMGEILDAGWKLKRGLTASISSREIDEYYAVAKKHGAIGGKLLGAGGGGFLLLYVRPKNQPNVLQALNELKNVDFRFENQGSQVIYYS